MKKIVWFTSLLFLGLQISFGQNEAQTAADLYNNAEYEKAAEAYAALTETYPNSYEIWYNLGNSSYKAGHLGYSVAAYRKALKLKPGDADALENLRFVFEKTADKLEPAAPMFIVRQVDKLAKYFTSGAWAFLSLMLALAGLLFFVLYIFMKNFNVKKAGFTASLFCWLLSFSALSMAAHRYYYALESAAVIISTESDILAEPTENGTILLMLHEGATLKFVSREAGWVKVILPNGSIGYLPEKEVAII